LLPGCQLISRDEGVPTLHPGEMTFCIRVEYRSELTGMQDNCQHWACPIGGSGSLRSYF
jgi:hypothetical protein